MRRACASIHAVKDDILDIHISKTQYSRGACHTLNILGGLLALLWHAHNYA